MTYFCISAVVLGCVIVLYIHHAISGYTNRCADAAIGESHGCRASPRLPNQRLFGIDRLEQIFRANAESRLMELFLFHFRQTGSTLEQVFLGQRAFGTIEPKNIKAILQTNSKDWDMGNRRKAMFPFFGDGIFMQEGLDWEHSRNLLQPQFMHKQYENLDIFREPVNNLLSAIPQEGIVDLQPLLSCLTLDTITAFLFGESVNSLKTSEATTQDTFASAFDIAQDFLANRMRLPELCWLFDGSRFHQACKDVHHFADQIIDQILRNNTGKSRYAFLESIGKDRTARRNQIINILVAGRDTTAHAQTWIFFLLLRHPKVFETLRSEISLNCTDDKDLRRSHLQKMPYLQKVVKETLRLYPPVSVNSRTAVRTTVLPVGGGIDGKSPVLVSKGTVVGYSVYSMHRDPTIYGMDAAQFRPERWNDQMRLTDNPTASIWGYLPFNGGPRRCLGEDFAMLQLAYTTLRVTQAFPRMSLPPNEKIELLGVEKQTMTLVMSIKGGCKVKLG